MLRSHTQLTALLIMVLFQIAFAQNTVDRDVATIDLAIKNYLVALNGNNDGAVESTIINLMNLRYYYPKNDYSLVRQKLQELEEKGNTRSIRLLSYIVRNYIQYPQRFVWLDEFQRNMDGNFYVTIAGKIHSQMER